MAISVHSSIKEGDREREIDDYKDHSLPKSMTRRPSRLKLRQTISTQIGHEIEKAK
jgi:hypothetical protein